MLLIDIRSTNASAAEFILDRLKLYLAGRHHHSRIPRSTLRFLNVGIPTWKSYSTLLERKVDLS